MDKSKLKIVFIHQDGDITGSAISLSNMITGLISNGSVGANGQLLASNGSATYWFTQPTPPAPSGSNTNITFNDSGNFGGSNGFTFNKTTNNVSVANTLTIGGSLQLANNVANNATLRAYKEFVATTGGVSGATTIDLSVSNVFRHTLTGNTTYTFSNPPTTGTLYSFTLITTQDATGGRVITWPAAAKWPGGLLPPGTTNANAIDVWNFITYDGGTTYLGTLSGKDVR